MTQSKKLVIRILLLVARIVADDDEALKKELSDLSSHIVYYKFGDSA